MVRESGLYFEINNLVIQSALYFLNNLYSKTEGQNISWLLITMLTLKSLYI